MKCWTSIRNCLTTEPHRNRVVNEVPMRQVLMSRSEGRALWVKMMHLMMKRRQVPDKNMSLVNETLYDGLATLEEDRQESDFRKQVLKLPPRRSYKYAEPGPLSSPRNFSDETVRRRNFEDASKEDANGEEGTSKRLNSRRHRRADYLDTKQLENIRLEPTLTTSLSFKENRPEHGIPEKLTADDSTGKFAYISLDGRLVNAELATSATSIGGGLGDEEAQAWEEFAPMQRVLIVAVSAAAAAAAKHRNRKEIDLLLKTVETRENELILLRQQLSELCTQSRTTVSHIHPEPLENLAAKRNPKTPTLASTRKHSFDFGSTKVKLDQHEAWSSSKSTPDVERVLSRDNPVNKDVVIVESSINVTPCTGESFSSSKSFPEGDKAWATEEAKWYVNPMVDTSQDFYSMSTPERNNSMFSICNPAAQGSFEWTVMRSSFATQDTDSRLPFTETPPKNKYIQATVGTWGNYQTRLQLDGTLHKEHKAMRAVCAAVVLDLRERMLKVLDKEASMVMAALDKIVEESKAQIASMHLGVASCWNDSVPKALAALSLSPSEFDSYLTQTQGAASTWSDISKIEESIVSWRQYLETNYGTKVKSERMSPSKWSSVERAVSDERLTSSACPRCSGQEDEETESQSGGLACPRNSAAELTEQLIRELDKAATKVAVMERQMRKLEHVAECDSKKISKLPECTKQELEKQIKSRDDVAELVRQLQSKEVEVTDLKKGQQNLKRKSKTRKMEEENILCPMASPKDYGTIYWERAAGLKKTKFLTEPGESKTKSDLLVTINEPKVLMDRKTKKLEEVKEDYLRRNVELDKRFAAAETTKAATADRIATLEEICKQDCTLSFLKQDIQSLESKVHGSREHQSPSVPRARRNSTSSTPNSSSGYGTSQKQRYPDKYAPSPSGSDPILEQMGRFRRDAPSYKGHYRNLHYINIQKYEELTDDGRSEQCYDQENSQEYSSPPGSTIGDDCSLTSLAFSETEVESRLGSEYCSSGDDSRNRSSKDQLSGMKGSSHNRTDFRRAITSTASSVRGLTRGPRKFPTSATSVSEVDAGGNHSIKSLNRMLPGEAKKPIKDSNNPRTSNLKVQRFVAPSKLVNHRRSSSLDMNLKPNICSFLETSGLYGGSLDGGSPDSQETSAIKRKRWV